MTMHIQSSPVARGNEALQVFPIGCEGGHMRLCLAPRLRQRAHVASLERCKGGVCVCKHLARRAVNPLMQFSSLLPPPPTRAPSTRTHKHARTFHAVNGSQTLRAKSRASVGRLNMCVQLHPPDWQKRVRCGWGDARGWSGGVVIKVRYWSVSFRYLSYHSFVWLVFSLIPRGVKEALFSG